MNSVLLLEEISIKQFVSDLKSMLLGVESDTFVYLHAVRITINCIIQVTNKM